MEDVLIDRFVVNISSTGEVLSSYSGIFGLAIVIMTTEIVCIPEFMKQCETYNVIPEFMKQNNITNLPTMNLALIVATPTILIILLFGVIAFLSIVTIILYWKMKKATTTEVVKYMRGRNGDSCDIQTLLIDNSPTINSTTPYYSMNTLVSFKGIAQCNVKVIS